MAKNHYRHGCSHSKNQKVTKEYRVWIGLRGRCKNPRNKDYARYGGRGIKVSPLWDDFVVFLADMGPCPQGYEIDRIDPNGDYEASNCRWVPEEVQANNRRNNVLITYKGKTMSATQWSVKYGKGRNYFCEVASDPVALEQAFYRLENKLDRRKLNTKISIEMCRQIKTEYLAIPVVNKGRSKGTLRALADKYGVSTSFVMKMAKREYPEYEPLQEGLIARLNRVYEMTKGGGR